MFRHLACVLFIIIKLNSGQNLVYRPMGRKVASIDEIPYQVSLRRASDNGLVCSGSLISNNTAITAAQCVVDGKTLINAEDILVVAGTSYLTETAALSIQVRYIIIDVTFDPKTLHNDIAVLKLKTDIQNDLPNVKWVELRKAQIPDGIMCSVSGWGLNGNLKNMDKLQVLQVEIDKEACDNNISYNEVCAGAPWTGAKQQDSGGPFVCEGLLTGVISVDSPVSSPQTFTKVSEYVPWIHKAAALTELPDFQVSLRYRENNTHFCGGSLINGSDILTTAACVTTNGNETINSSTIVVVAREEMLNKTAKEGSALVVKEIVIHPKFDGVQNNIAIIKLHEEILASHSSLRPMKVATSDVPASTLCIATRFDEANFLKKTVVTTRYSAACRTTGSVASANDLESQSVLCAEAPFATCKSDLGGPLVCGDQLAGMLLAEECGSLHSRGEYLNIKNYVGWIVNGTEEVSETVTQNKGNTLAAQLIITIVVLCYGILYLF